LQSYFFYRLVGCNREDVMNAQNIVQVSAAILLSAVIASCAAPQGGGLRPTEKQFSSQWIDITMGGMMAVPGKGLALTLNLKNKTKQPVYVLVAFVTPDPAQRCEIAKQLDASLSALFSCPQKSLTPNKDYPIDISIYTDEGRTSLIENPKTKFYFTEKDARAFDELSRKIEAEKSK
jgi:hypothetical protein